MIKLPYQKYKIGECIVNCHDMSINTQSNSIQLPAKVFEFLKLLMLHPTETVTKVQAIDNVWAGNTEVGKRGAGNAIWHLRKSFTELGFEPDEIFKTITKVGYQLLITPEAINDSPLHVQANNKQPLNFAKRVYFMLAFFIMVALCTLSIINWFENSSSKNIQVIEPLKLTNFEGVEEQMAISADGRYMAFQWRRNQKKSQLFIKDLTIADSPLRQVSMTNDNETSPSWSPDGLSLAYFRLSNEGLCSLHIRELISNRDQVLATDCINKENLHSLDWSNDGKKIAYSKNLGDRIAIAVYHLDEQTSKIFTSPKSGEEDLIMKWGPNSQDLLFVRSSELKANVYISNSENELTNIAQNNSMVIGLAWSSKSNKIYYNTMKNGQFTIKEHNLNSQETRDFYNGKGLGSLAINNISNTLFFSRHIAQEYISVHSLSNGHLLNQLASSSRDLYGKYVASTDEILFFSNRSGSWELWLKQDKGNKQLTSNQGQLSLPAVSPANKQYVVPIKTIGGQHFSMYQGDLASNKLEQLFELDGDVRNPSYSNDGTKLFFSANQTGDWQLYSYQFASKTISLISHENIKFAVEADNGDLYYSKDNTNGIYLKTAGGIVSQITQELEKNDWGSFFFLNDSLYFLKRTDEQDVLVKLNKNGMQEDIMSLPILSIRNNSAFSPMGNDRVVVSMQGINDADIYSMPL